MARRRRNGLVVALVAVLILATAVYAPVALLAPLPATAGTPVAAATSGSDAVAPPLPQTGASALTLGSAADPVVAGSTDPVPMAAAAKLVTALVVLDERPLEGGDTGPQIEIEDRDFATYVRYRDEGTRAVRVVTGDEWSQRDVLAATLIASSNNHAELLARWAFGSAGGYLEAARAWLERNGLSGTSVVDSTGLSPDSVSTGADMARLAALAMADPTLAELVRAPSGSPIRGTSFENTIAYRPGDGLVGLSRSYTDEAGVVLLFAYPTEVEGAAATVYGAIAGASSYDQLSVDIDALLNGLAGALALQQVVVEGEAYGTYDTPWGASVDAVATGSATGVGWAGSSTGAVEVALEEVVTARSGTRVGTASASTLEGVQTVPLELSAPITDPGPLWRVLNPATVVPAFVEMVRGEG